MSDFSPEQDELASAYLDDEATPEERARVEADPTLLVRVEALRAVHDALAASVEPPAAAREAAIQAALRGTTVVDLTAARARKRVQIVSIAAAILLVIGVAGALIRNASTQKDATFQAVAGSIGSTAANSTAAQASPRAAADAAGAAGGSTASATNGRPDLGSFADQASLVAATQQQVHDPAFGQQKSAGSPMSPPEDSAFATTTAPTCLVPAPSDSSNQLYAATAVLDGRSVQIDVFTIVDGSLTLVVTDVLTCTQVFTQSI